jgi:Carboxypeptidase regulatory-like domain/TonB dependent receptor-like, beta-barrel
MRLAHGPSVTLVTLAIVALSTTSAQAQTARITGTVTDSTNAVVPGATVTIVKSETNDTRVAVSNDRGQYDVPFLPSGHYTITCELQGFQKMRREGVVLETDQEVRVDFDLPAGAITESVLVVGTPVLAADTSSVGQVVTGQTISDLPLNGRNFLQLARLATGVLESAAGDRAAEGGAFVANGARSVLNSFMLDGVDNNARIVDQQNSSNVVSQPSVDALSEFSIQTNNFSAEYGQAAGAVINATIRSGTNTIRAVGFEFLRDDAFDARNPFAPSSEEKRLSRHQYGGTVGGPFRRDRTFFFASWETTDENRGTDYRQTVPTVAQRAGDFRGFVNNQGRPVIIYDPATTRPNPSGTGFIRDPFPNNQIPADRIHSMSRRLLELLPEANLPDLTGNYVVTRDAVRMRHQLDTRLDQSFSTNSKLYVRYSLTNRDDGIPGPYEAPLIGTTQFQQAIKEQLAHNVAIGQTQVLGRNRVNELRIGYNRIRDDLFPWVTDTTPAGFGFKGIPEVPGVTGLSRIAIGGFSNLGEAAFLPNFKISEVTQAGDTFSFLQGRHAFKAGANYRFIRSFFNISAQARGFYNFTGGFSQNPQARANSGSGLADFLLGIPATTQLSTTLPGDIRYHYVAGYLQDDWRASPRLTLNLGVRYELFTQPYERNGQQANLLLDQLKLIYVNDNVPSSTPAAFATTVPDGVSKTTLMRNDTNNFAPRLGFAFKLRDRTVLRGGAGIFYGDHPTIGASGRLPANPPYQVNVSYATDSITPIVTFDSGFPANALDPVFSPFLAMNAWDPNAPQAQAYHWNVNVQHELPWIVVEIGYTGSHGTKLSVNWDPNAPLPGPGSVASRRPFPEFGGIGGVKYDGESDYHAGHVRIERRLRQGFSIIGHYSYAKSIDLGGANFISGDLVYRDPRNIELDRARSSFDVRHNMVLSYIWDIPVGSGRRVNVTRPWLNAIAGGWQFNGITTAHSGTPFTPALSFNPAQSGHARPDRIGDGNLPRGQRSADRWFDPSAFAAAVPFNIGNAGRNILIAPGVFNTDFGLFKRFRFDSTGRHREVQIRIEAFNVFNEAHYAQPNATVDLLEAGRITAIVGTMREMQLGIKVLF